MKKEVFLAISIGFVLGLIITFGIWTANKSLKQLPKTAKNPTPAASQEITATPSPFPNPSAIPLTISNPEDELLVSTSSITVTGTTSPKALVSIISENGNQIIEADTAGDFSAKISLEGGYNNISVSSSNTSGNSATVDLMVTYTTSKI